MKGMQSSLKNHGHHQRFNRVLAVMPKRNLVASQESAASFNAPRRIFAQSEQGFDSLRTLKTIGAICVSITV